MKNSVCECNSAAAHAGSPSDKVKEGRPPVHPKEGAEVVCLGPGLEDGARVHYESLENMHKAQRLKESGVTWHW